MPSDQSAERSPKNISSGIEGSGCVLIMGEEPLHDRDSVTRFQHRRKISSILIRNTVVPIATPTTLGSCLAIEDVKSPKPGVVMCIIPLDVQRRCERRWAAQFSRPPEFESVALRNQGPESQQIVGPDNKRPPGGSGGLASAD
jgi:hypothetical protein